MSNAGSNTRRFMSRPTAGAVPRFRLSETDAIRRPVHGEDLADDVLARHRAPFAGIARLDPVVAHEEVLARRDVPLAVLAVAPARLDIRLDQLLAVDEDDPVALGDRLVREA